MCDLLLEAVKERNVQSVRRLLDSANPLEDSLWMHRSAKSPYLMPIHLAVQNVSVRHVTRTDRERQAEWEVLRLLLDAKPSQVALTDELGRTPLHYAAARGNQPVCEVLIAAGASLSTSDDAGLNAAAHASRADHNEVKRWLLAQMRALRLPQGVITLTPESVLDDGSVRGSFSVIRVAVRSDILRLGLLREEAAALYSLDLDFVTGHARRLPIGEVLDTISVQLFGADLPPARLRFVLNGAELDGSEEVAACGLRAASEAPNVLEVHDRTEGLASRARLMEAMNSLARRVDGMPATLPPGADAGGGGCELATAEGAGADVTMTELLPTELLSEVYSWLPDRALLACCGVCRAWLWSSLRHCLLRQLQAGDLRLAPAQDYAAWLRRLGRCEWSLALDASTGPDAAGTAARPGTLLGPAAMLAKEAPADGHRHFSSALFGKFQPLQQVWPFRKRSGRDVSFARRSAVRARRSAVRAYLAALERGRPALAGAEEAGSGAASASAADESAAAAAVQAQAKEEAQRLPPAGSDGFVAEAHAPQLRREATELFQRYFGQDVHDLLPLVVGQQPLGPHQLDFRSVHTWAIFGPLPPSATTESRSGGEAGATPEAAVRAMLGAVAWRLHTPHAVAAGPPVRPVLEVLFLAVKPEGRNAEYGRMLVAALEAHAAALPGAGSDGRGVLMYVEAAAHESAPRKFWGNQGFAEAPEMAAAHIEQLAHIEGACWRFNDTVQLCKLVQHRQEA